MRIHELTATELIEKIVAKELTCREVVKAYLERIEAVESKVNAFLQLDPDGALKRAVELDEKLARGDKPGKLIGIPVALKDNLCVKGMKTTCASKILENFEPPFDAHIVERLVAEDAVIIGKTNMDEFAMGSSTENSAFKKTSNPWDLERVPGGSSGGSAAAVAAGMCPIAIGSDTGGSIRQPAGFCGVVGVKPTYGRVSRYGVVAFASSLDQIGAFARDVRDASLASFVISGHDKRDSTSAEIPVPDYPAILERDISGIRIGVPKEYFAEGLIEDVEKSVKGAIKVFEGLGAEIKEISMPHSEYAVATYYIIAPAEASSNLARYDGVHYGHRSEDAGDLVDLYSKSRAEGFGPEVQRRVLLGTFALSSGYYDAYYMKASKVRRLIKRDFDEAFKNVDCIIAPTSPTTAFKIGEKIDDLLSMYLADVFTIPVNMAGIQAIAVPCGFSNNNLPVSMQIIGPEFREEHTFQVAHAYQSVTDYHKKMPTLD